MRALRIMEKAALGSHHALELKAIIITYEHHCDLPPVLPPAMLPTHEAADGCKMWSLVITNNSCRPLSIHRHRHKRWPQPPFQILTKWKFWAECKLLSSLLTFESTKPHFQSFFLYGMGWEGIGNNGKNEETISSIHMRMYSHTKTNFRWMAVTCKKWNILEETMAGFII